ncbi:TerL protein [Rufibacter sp. H-1]|uniref:TerL protein n=2 Tax=Rufibacter sediminis TaxID=2762756 RepID=A0ABR6VTX2_9BACT|nr:hypothetical protein [Rufibacter sediminis]MBC3540646.1 TerL protein [Rufibacter sediminis]
MEFYRENPVQWINDWAITYNPRNKKPLPKIMPFLLFKRQEEFVQFLMECLHEGENGLVEKCRDIGATWLCAAISAWLWLFIPGASIGWGSRKEQLVDRSGDPDSIFQKIRMIINNLPGWMLPAGFNDQKNMTHMKIINPTGATITGEAGDNIGRGGRKLIYFKDESAHYERPELIEAALGDNTDVQIDISSVYGTGNVFYRRRMAGEVWLPGKKIAKGKTRVFVFDWRDHPGKNQEWYDQRRAKAESEGLLHLFAQEVDRDYSASLEGVIIPAKWVEAAVDAHIKLKFVATGEKVAALDVADEGGDKNALAMRYGVVLQYGEHWGEGDAGESARRAVMESLNAGMGELYYDAVGVGAAVKSETNRMKKDGQIPRTLSILPWLAGASPLNPEGRMIPDDLNTPMNKDFFANLKAQAWWNLRTRFEKTYKAVTQGVTYNPDELISLPSNLPNLHEIKMELSQAQKKATDVGKFSVDKKPDGTRSPNLADAIVMCYTPVRTGVDYSKLVW